MRLLLGLAAVALLPLLGGCGKYIPPVPPEALAPLAVDDLDAIAYPDRVAFTWKAPDKDRRGKELQSIDGYAVQRKDILKRGDETNPEIEFDDVGFVKDTHVEVREKLRKEAREQGKIGRTIKAPEELTEFAFSDTKVANGKTYLYQIMPQNQGGVDGVVKQVVKVQFKGAESEVVIFAAKDAEDTGEAGDEGPVGRQ